MGVCNAGELRPYRASGSSGVPEPYRWEVPVGIWRPVGLEYIGPIAIDWMRLKPSFEAGDGRLEVEARLRNLARPPAAGQITSALSSAPRAGPPPPRLTPRLSPPLLPPPPPPPPPPSHPAPLTPHLP